VNYIHQDLFAFQKEGALWLPQPRRSAGPFEQNAILADEMGLGKTPQAIAGCDLVKARNILVVCPGIARENWEREFLKWQMIPRTTCLIKKGTDRPTADVVVASYTSLQSRPVLVALLARRWDVVVFDEAHALKNPQSLTTMICYGADCTASKGLVSRADRTWLLSGTIIPNGPHEMWTHARALFPDAVKNLESYNRWLDRFCYWKEERGVQRVLNAINVPEFVERLHPYIKRRLMKDVLPDLPPLRFGHVVVAPSKVPPMPEQAAEADTIIRAALGSLNSNPTPEEVQAVLNAESMHIASLLRWTGVAKAPAVAEAIRTDMENGLKKIVVFARHKDVFTILEKQIPGAVSITGDTPDRKRQEIIDTFQGRVPNKDIGALLCHIDIASTALTLTASCDVGFAETGWVVKDILQAVKRCHRIGQTKPVLAKIYSLKGSLDEAVSDTIVRKYKMVSHIESHFVG
jgi:SWI/SNF-related matrix-associated actin-dependent regulator 1 of chromatin subfamily A